MTKILTEEELKKLEWLNQNSFQLEYNAIEDLINSHRNLLSANAELSFKNQKLKAALTDISTHVVDIMSNNVYYEAYLQVKGAAYRALEELK